MKQAVILGWLAELEMMSESAGTRMDDVAAAAMEGRRGTAPPQQHHDHWRVFAVLAAVPLRRSNDALSPPS